MRRINKLHTRPPEWRAEIDRSIFDTSLKMAKKNEDAIKNIIKGMIIIKKSFDIYSKLISESFMDCFKKRLPEEGSYYRNTNNLQFIAHFFESPSGKPVISYQYVSSLLYNSSYKYVCSTVKRLSRPEEYLLTFKPPIIEGMIDEEINEECKLHIKEDESIVILDGFFNEAYISLNNSNVENIYKNDTNLFEVIEKAVKKIIVGYLKNFEESK